MSNGELLIKGILAIGGIFLGSKAIDVVEEWGNRTIDRGGNIGLAYGNNTLMFVQPQPAYNYVQQPQPIYNGYLQQPQQICNGYLQQPQQG